MNASLLRNMCLSIACFMLASANGTRKQKTHQQRIIGGRAADEKYPFIVSMLLGNVYDSNFHCAGSIINKRTVLTAAHCLQHHTAEQLKIHAGEQSLELISGLIYDVEDIYSHKQYNYSTQDYDVGLVRIKDSFIFNRYMRPITLASRKFEIKDGSIATVLGWGYTDEYNQIPSPCLMVGKVPIVSQTKCKSQIELPITKRMLCAGYESGGVDACQLDSGGPLLIKNVQIGIVSWGIECALPYKPGVYARVSELLPWIEEILFEKYVETSPVHRV